MYDNDIWSIYTYVVVLMMFKWTAKDEDSKTRFCKKKKATS